MQASLTWEPSLKARFLPRCPHCGSKHPLAYDPPIKSENCPSCGKPCAPAEAAFDVPAVLTGKDYSVRFGLWLLKIADLLRKRG